MNYFMNYRGYDIWEYINTVSGYKYYYVYAEGMTSQYNTLIQAKAAINSHINKINKYRSKEKIR